MAQQTVTQARTRFWFALIAIIIFLIFLYFYAPFEALLVGSIPNIHFDNVVFWVASVVGILAYIVAHWQSFRRNIFRHVSELNAEDLVFDALQSAILVAVILFAGATLQAVANLAVHLMERGKIIDPVFGKNLLAIVLLVIFVVLFFLLHYLVRAFRNGGQKRSRLPRVTSGS